MPHYKIPPLTFSPLFKRFFQLLFLLIIFSLGYSLGVKESPNTQAAYPSVNLTRDLPADQNLDFSLFWQVWDTLEESYYDTSKLIPSEMVYGAIKGMVDAVGDPYTAFLLPRENEVVREDLSGNFEGVGIQIGFRGTQLAVAAPLPGSPAEKAGIQPGDFIVGIQDEQKDIDRSTVGINLPEAVQLIRGPAGTTVTLALTREGSDKVIYADVVREQIDVPSLVLEFVGDKQNIAHVRILKFGGETVSEWDEAALEILKKDDLSGIIVDVRNNTGGYLQAAVDIASDFLPENETVVIEEKANSDERIFTTSRRPRFGRESVVMLVNQGSASASEILAGALRDQLDVSLVGTSTFGKGTIQEPRQVEHGAAIHITTARWLTPSRTWVNDVGLEPDYMIEDDQDTSEDEQLQQAISLL